MWGEGALTGDSTSSAGIPSSYDQYENPTDAAGKSQGYAWWQGIPIGTLGPATNMLGGDRYVDEGDPSWEDVITMVVIPGEPGHIRSAAGVWEVIFSRIEQAKALLDDGIGDLKSWEGDAGTAYREHLTGVSKEIGTLIDQHRPVITALNTAADNLESAIDKIPIPDDMAHEVKAAKDGFINSGNVAGLGPDAIYQTLMPIFSNKWVDELRETFSWDWAQKNLRDWISSQDDEAKAAYQQLAGEHVTTMDNMPLGDSFSAAEPGAGEYTPVTSGTSPSEPSGVPSTGASDLNSKGYTPSTGTSVPDGSTGTDIPSSSTTTPGTTSPSYDTGTTSPSSNDYSGSTTDPDSGSGLAGAGGGGLTGAGAGGLGSGAGGLGSGAGGGAVGLGGLSGMATGTSGLGAGAAGLGSLAGSGLGAGALGKGASAGMGMGGAGHGGQGAGDGEEHSTWLNEDGDPWGSDNDLAPPVLGV
ncbi:hypothetical protein [Actinoplanes sp. NPDC051851]|uniref:WXG100 family type VII secretion target n=1 Tax=Actinoplanes sp. NPDC051851 TaxID=3154753 RepID=UPI003440AB2F